MRYKRANTESRAPIMRALLFGSLAALFIMFRGAASDQSIYVTVARSGCAITQPNEALNLSLWKAAQYPGDGSTLPPITTLAGTWTTIFKTEPGYYRVELASEHCWERFVPVAVLPGHPRHIRLRPWDWVKKENVDYDSYTVPYGAVVGQLKSGQSAPSLLKFGESASPNYVASLESDGFYYFDQVTSGSYTLSIPSQKGAVRKTIDANENKITVVPIF